MNKRFALIVMAAVLCLPFAGCTPAEKESSVPTLNMTFQELSDQSQLVKEFAEEEFARFLQNSGEYEILQTNYGFVTDDPPKYYAGFQYRMEDTIHYYAYQISVDDAGQCTILAEGEDVAEFLFF